MKSKKIGLFLLTGALVAAPLFSLSHQVLAKEKSATTTSVSKKATKEPEKVKTSKQGKGYRIENNLFQVDVGQHGEIASLILKQDKFKTNYVMNETDNPQQATAGHQWVGELMFRTKKGNSNSWQKEYTGPSKSARKIELVDNKVVVTYENASETNGIKNLKVVETYALNGDQLQWSIDVCNVTSEKVAIGDFGLPLPFREFWTYPSKNGDSESTTAYEGSVLDHSFVGQDASYIYASRPSGMGDFLVMTPDIAKGGRGFEYQDHWIRDTNGRTAEEIPWCMDQAGWANGLNVFYLYSEAIKGENKGYLPSESLVLQPGESKQFVFNFNASDLSGDSDTADMTSIKYETALKDILYKENIMDAVSVPGMVIPKGTDGKAKGQMYLHTSVDKDKISFDYQCMHNDVLNGGTNNIDDTAGVPHVKDGAKASYQKTVTKNGEQYHIYNLVFSELGNNNIIVNYEIGGEQKKTTLQYYVIDDPEKALADHSQFLLKTQWDAPGELQDKVFDDWMMNTKKKRGEFGGYWGWGDDWGLVHGTYLAEMNSKTPKKEQVLALDEYLDVAIWNGLMQEHQEDYLIHDFLMEEPNNTPTYRGFAYPHIYNTYFAMYKIARNNPDLIEYKESADEYLFKAYNIMEALYKDGVGYNWHTGVMGEVTTPKILQELKARGFNKEAKSIEKKMETKYNNFAKDKYPYVSEYPYDNTSEEAIYMLGSLQGDAKMMAMVDLKTRACRGVQPIWYHYGNPTTICGENWFNFQYTASLAGTAMDDWLRNQENGMTATELGLAARANYAGKLANLTHINSGQISSDPENIGTVSWTYQAELGNYAALGTGAGKLHNGWRQMSGEADLALFGALQILSTDVVEDPIFGLVGYGGDVTKKDGNYTVKLQDGLRQRVNLINEQLSFEVETDKFKTATIAADGTDCSFEVENVTKKAHDLELTITESDGKAGDSYQVFYNGEKVGTYETNKKTTTLQVPITDKDGTLEIKKGKLLTDSTPTVSGKDIKVSLDEAKDVRLLGRARDNAWLQKQADPKWQVKQAPTGGKVEFSAENNEITTASFNKAGVYTLELVANGLNKQVTKEITVTVKENGAIPTDLANYDFAITKDDIIANTLRNIGKTGYDSALKGNNGNIKTAEGKNDNQALDMSGKIGGYVQLNPNLTKRVDEATATIDLYLKDKQVAGARILEWQDTSGNLLSLRFATENELELVAKTSKMKEATTAKSGVSLLKNQWRNLEVTIKKDAIVLYVDGSKVTEIRDVALTLADFGETQRSFIGRADSESAPWLNGRVDNFTLRSKALSLEELQTEFGLDLEAKIESLQNVSLVTSVKQAPKLPSQLTATYNNGTTRKVVVEWSEIKASQYEKVGEFTVTGKVEGTDIQAQATIQVVRGEKTNLASLAKPSAIVNTPEDLGGVAGLNDGFEPTSSGDTSHGVWHNWLGGDQAGESWVEYTWEDAMLITGMDSYYFFNGSNFAPSSVRLVYMDENGKWQEFKNLEGAGVALDQYNRSSFDPVRTKRVRMYMNPVNLGTGVIEWKVYGYSEKALIDKELLSNAIAGANQVKEAYVTKGASALKTSISAGQKILDQKDAKQSEIDVAAFAILRAYRDLEIKDNNWALVANVTTSYVSGWEKVAAVNDDQVPAKSSEKTVDAYGSWGNASDGEILIYTWPTAVCLNEAAIYFWTDGGGILFPEQFTVEYLDTEGNWQVFGEASQKVQADQFNTVKNGDVTTKSVRLTMKKVNADSNGVGVFEWQMKGSGATASAANPASLKAAIKEAEACGPVEKYSPESWQALQEALNLANDLDQSDLLIEEAQTAITRIKEAMDQLEEVEIVDEGRNLAPEATISGSFEDVNDLGGYLTMNDLQPIENSSDTKHGTWHNWNGREKEPYVVYTWEKAVAISKSKVYFFSDGGGIREASTYDYEYLDDAGNWQTVKDGQNLAPQLDMFNETKMMVTTKALQIKLTPQQMNEVEKHGVGIIEWQVFGE